MKILALDISTRAGWAVLESTQDSKGEKVEVVASGLVEKEKPILEYAQYPRCYRLGTKYIADQLVALVVAHSPFVVVVEETNQGRSRYTQKILEWIHLYFQLAWDDGRLPTTFEPVYISTGEWKHVLGLKKPPDAKKKDRLLKRAQELASRVAADGTAEYRRALNQEKKRLGVKGKWNKKMLAVNFVNETYGWNWKLKDNDKAEAICLGLAYLQGATVCDGDPSGKGKNEDTGN